MRQALDALTAIDNTQRVIEARSKEFTERFGVTPDSYRRRLDQMFADLAQPRCEECDAKDSEPCGVYLAILHGYPDGTPDCPRDAA